ncbi:MAG: molecular chaperone SurA [Legionellaceae bacterium]|nr:molecular chaperone SurA [Legionellaceae bacterium]HCA89651.1 molecular chaperone SurA [Legionellales bacterium]
MIRYLGLIMILLPIMAFSQTLDKVIAVINEGVITESELHAEVDTMTKQLQAKGMKLPAPDMLRKQVLQHLIDVNLALQLAKKHHITIEDSELDEAINKIATTNHLTLSQLREELTRQALDWQTYRRHIRQEMTIAKLEQKAVGKESFVTPAQVEEYIKTAALQDKSHLLYHLQNLIIPLEEHPTAAQVNKSHQKAMQVLKQIKAQDDLSQVALNESTSEFVLEESDLGERPLIEIPEVFAKTVVSMKPGEISAPIRTANGFQLVKLVAIKDTQANHQVTKTHVRHILLKAGSSMTTTEAQIQAKNIYQQLKSGKDFSTMAKQYSADMTSAVKGGDLGWVTPGELVPEFEKKMDGLALNQISQPVKSTFGWHIIQVLDRKSVNDAASFKRQQARILLQQKKFAEAIEHWQHNLRADAYIKILATELA